MGKMRIYYYTSIKTDKSEEAVYDEFPDEINYDAKRGNIHLIKDSIESVSDNIEYGEG
jgi:hypothetical protein